MDGFYVAKIQKLSDKRPEEDAEKAQEEVVEEAVESTSDNEIDWGAEVKKAISKEKEMHVKENPIDTTKEEETVSDSDVDEKNAKKNRDKKSQVSMPPKGRKKRKNSTNAKINKPRRRKQPVEM